MKLIRRFFAYLIALIVVLLVTYGYVYRDDLFGKDTPTGQLIAWMTGQNQQVAVESDSVSPDQVVAVEELVTEPVADLIQEEAPASTVLPAGSALPVVVDMPEMAVADEVTPVTAEPPNLGDLWKRARHSFHYRDYPTSVESYQQIIASTQDNFDAYEELADVYVYYGKNEEAASAYFEAASILVRLDKLERAADFLKPLSLMDVNKARALLDQLEAAKAK